MVLNVEGGFGSCEQVGVDSHERLSFIIRFHHIGITSLSVVAVPWVGGFMLAASAQLSAIQRHLCPNVETERRGARPERRGAVAAAAEEAAATPAALLLSGGSWRPRALRGRGARTAAPTALRLREDDESWGGLRCRAHSSCAGEGARYDTGGVTR